MSKCASCGAALEPDHRFCPSCGTARGEPGTAEREARKVVSALFCDVVGSTPLGERLDPEDFTTVVGGAVARMAESVEQFGGSVVELAGDGLLALFGAPAAHEDDAERAVRAGLRILERIDAYRPELARRWDVDDFAVRVGIETGLAILGPLGAGRKVEYSAMGDALNTAARLQAAADPGTVLVGERTRRAVDAAFDWGPPRRLELKGKAERVTAHPVAGVREDPAPRGLEAPLVGRVEELAAGREAIDAVRHGTGGALFVTGEGGIGKSRLVHELRGAFEDGGGDGRWLHARCASYGADVPYRPVRALLLEWLRDGDGGAPAQRLRAACREALGDDAPGVEPFLLALLDEPDGAGPDLAPEGVQARTVGAVAALLAALAARAPLVVSVDDLHWADPSTLELLGPLLELTDDAALLLVLSSRPERDHGSWGLRERALRELPHRAREVRLDVLAGEDDRALLDALVGRGALPPGLERRILERAEGNPFYLEETVRSLMESGALARTADGWRLDPGAEVEVPETVEKLVLSRIDRLAPDRHDVLSAAAVLGRSFELAVLERVVEVDPRPALRDLQRLELLREGRRWPVPEYRFRHPLIQEAAYGALLRRRRQDLHHRAATAIAEVHAAALDDQAGVLARHHHEAGDLEPAFALHGRAADAALRIHAQEEALEHLDGALAAAAALGRGPEDAEVRGLFARRAALRYAAEGDFEGAAADFGTAIEAARAAGDGALEVEGLSGLAGVLRRSDWDASVAAMDTAVSVARGVGDPPLLAGALARQSIAHSNLLRLDSSLEIAGEALRTAAGTDDSRARVAALDALKLAALMLGDLPRLDALCRELLELLESLEASASVPRGPEMLPRAYRAWALQEWAFVPAGAGDWEQAERRLREGLDIVERDGWVTYRAVFLDTLARIRRGAGDLAGALAAAEEGAAVARGNPEWRAWAQITAGWMLLDSDRARDAAQRLEAALGLARRAASPMNEIRALGLLADARRRLGDTGAARDAAAAAEARLGEASFPPGGAFLYGAHAIAGAARALAAAGEPLRARALAEPALAAAERAGWDEARTDLADAVRAAAG